MALSPAKFPPSKPHFFKPLLPDFLDGILIPISFFKYLDGHKCEGPVLLRTSRGNWTVKINGRRMMDGWIDFAQDNGLEVGDFLVFGHEGNMVFDVMVFDKTACKREYTSFNISHQFPKKEQESSDSDSDSEMDLTRSKSIPENPVMAHVEANSCSFKLDHPYFVSTMKPYSLAGYTINIPKAFARSNGLSNRQCDMVIKDEKRSWLVGLTYNCEGQVFIGNGWRSFRDAKHLKEGDTFALELVKNGKKPIMHFHCSKRIPNNPHMACVEAKSLSFKRDRPYFVSTLKPYAETKLYIPKGFASSNGLRNRRCEMIIKDEQRSWHARLNQKVDGQVYIGSGWRSFRDAKGLKEGNTFALELVKNGKKPIMHFHWVDAEGKGRKKISARPCYRRSNAV